MSTRYYCDQCGEEMRPEHLTRLCRKFKRLSLEVITAIDGIWNGGYACWACITEAVEKGNPINETDAIALIQEKSAKERSNKQ